MVLLQKIEPSSFAAIYPLLRSHDPDLSPATWQSLFNYPWQRSSSYCGYGLFDGETAVGFLGMIFSQRRISNQTHNVCNLTTWVVRPDYRSHSFSLMMPIMRLKDHTITDLSATNDVARISERLGFKPLETSVSILLPYSKPDAELEGRLYSNDEIASLSLSATTRHVFADHRSYDSCHQLLLRTQRGDCHVLYTVNIDPRLSCCHIQSISNLDLFERHQAKIRQRIVQDTGIPLIAVDSRLVDSVDVPSSFRLPLGVPRLYLSQQLQPEQIDNAYSELILLDLNAVGAITLKLHERLLLKMLKPVAKQWLHWRSSLPLAG